MARPNPTEDELKAMLNRGGAKVRGGVTTALEPGQVGLVAPGKRALPVSNPAPSPYKSKLEALYARELAALEHAGVIISWQYEPLNFRLPGQRNFYKPDFLVRDDGGLTFYEVKGRNISDDRSLVKIKTAAGLNTWARFMLVKRIKGQWEERHVA